MDTLIANANFPGNQVSLVLNKVNLTNEQFIELFNQLKSKTNTFSTDELIVINYEQNKCKSTKFINGESNQEKSWQHKSVGSLQSRFNLSTFTYTIESYYNDPIEINASDKLKTIDIKYIFQFVYSSYPDWLINLSMVKTIIDKQEFSIKLHEYKNTLIKNYDPIETTLDSNAYDYVQISVDFIGENFTKAKFNEFTRYFNKALQDEEKILKQQYQSYIYNTSKLVYFKELDNARFKQQKGFKNLVNNVIELNRPMYFKTILPDIENYYITDKIDGQRALIYIVEHYNKKKLLGVNIKAISDKLYSFDKYSYEPDARTTQVLHIFDAEMLNKDKHPTFYVFDVICVNGKNWAHKPFYKRFEQFDACSKVLDEYKLGSIKKFVKLTTDYKNELTNFYNEIKKSKYSTDGIIFTPAGSLYDNKLPRFQKQLNTEYYNTLSFKWKPSDKMTIDFYMMKIPEDKISNWDIKLSKNETLYVLCSGVESHVFKQLKLQFFDGYLDLIKPQFLKAQYFPIQFSPDDSPLVYLYKSIDDQMDNRVGEFLFKDNKFHLERIRDDRDVEIARGTYLGNALRYAELIWRSIKSPLTFELLLSEQNSSYFASESSHEYFAQRAFNSYVKGTIIENFLKKDSLLDLMGGKGQDIARIADLGFKKVFLMDKDVDAIHESVDRKFNLKLKKKDTSINVHIRQLDVGADYQTNVEELSSLKYLSKESVDSVMVNFGIHYLMNDIKSINNCIQLINYYLVPKGRVMITHFDGRKIFELLGDQKSWDGYENDKLKYSIQKNYKSDTLMQLNQSIKVLLPFSGNEYYEESLVNTEYLISLFNSNGFKLVETNSFSVLLENFKKANSKIYNQLTDLDKEYDSLYQYTIFEKN
jgi:hypothetical protein